MTIQAPSPQNPGPELSTPVDGNEDVKGDAAKDSSERPFPAPSELMREDQVQNAVKFLSHPKVRDSPIMYRRSFLEKKGLTKEEIDEAFRLVPVPPSNVTSVESVAINQAVQPKSSVALQPQAPLQSTQPAGAWVSNVSMVPIVQQPRSYWSHVLIAAGMLAASGAGTAVFFKNVVVPRLKTWIRKVAAEENESEMDDKRSIVLAEQTAEAAKAAATAAAVVAKASEELLNSKTEERKYFEAFMNMMDVQVEEMKSMGEAIRKLESAKETSHSQDKMLEEYIQSNMGNGTAYTSWVSPLVNPSDAGLSSVPKQPKVNGTANPDYAGARPSSAPATIDPPLHPKSYMEIVAMLERGERPPNIREINDMPPDPNQQPSKPVLAPRPKPWEVRQQKPSYSISPQPSIESLSSTSEDNNIHLSDANGKAHDSSEPWWKKKTVKLTETEPNANEQKFPYNFAGSGGDRSSQRGWVPPQPPAIAIPEAAAAIRQPKKQPPANEDLASVKPFVDTRIEPPEDLAGLIKETKQSEIEEVREGGIEIN